MIGLFKKKRTDQEAEDKLVTPLSSRIEDRVSRYVENQYTQTPKSYFKEVRKYWVWGAILNILSLLMMVGSNVITLNKNFNVELNLVRVDGGIVHESHDVRRSVMLKNALERNELKKKINTAE